METKVAMTPTRENHYHTGVFNLEKNTVLALSPVVGITLLVIGILVKFKVNHGISTTGANVLMSLGGGILGIELVTLLYFAHKHFSLKSRLKNHLSDNEEAIKISYQTLKVTAKNRKLFFPFTNDIKPSHPFYAVCQRELRKPDQVHCFTDKYKFNEYQTLIRNFGFSNPEGILTSNSKGATFTMDSNTYPVVQ